MSSSDSSDSSFFSSSFFSSATKQLIVWIKQSRDIFYPTPVNRKVGQNEHRARGVWNKPSHSPGAAPPAGAPPPAGADAAGAPPPTPTLQMRLPMSMLVKAWSQVRKYQSFSIPLKQGPAFIVYSLSTIFFSLGYFWRRGDFGLKESTWLKSCRGLILF